MYFYIQISSFKQKTDCLESFKSLHEALEFINDNHFVVYQTISDAAGNVCGFLCK